MKSIIYFKEMLISDILGGLDQNVSQDILFGGIGENFALSENA